MFPGTACVVALVDRFARHCHVVDIDADSWRQKNALACDGQDGGGPEGAPAARDLRRGERGLNGSQKPPNSNAYPTREQNGIQNPSRFDASFCLASDFDES